MAQALLLVIRRKTERISHYFEARLAGQFDAVLHFDVTEAIEPLERSAEWGADVCGKRPFGALRRLPS